MEITNITGIKGRILTLFEKYLEGRVNLTQLMFDLEDIEVDVIELLDERLDGEKGIWFHYFKGYTGSDSIRELGRDLLSRMNQDLILEHMQTAVDNPDGFKVYFS